MVCLLFGPVFGSGLFLTMTVVGVGGIWLLLSYRSTRGSSLAADSPLLIATGQFDEAEEHIERVLRSFSLFRAVKLLSLHHLAVLRHAQRRWRESAILSKELLHQLASREVCGYDGCPSRAMARAHALTNPLRAVESAADDFVEDET